MDFIGNLPPEVNEDILKHLSARDLWSCLSVCKRWRCMANTERLWSPHCGAINISATDVNDDENQVDCDFSLCSSASEWKRCNIKVVNWKRKRFKSVDLPDFTLPCFYSSNDLLVILDGDFVTVFNLRDENPFPVQFPLPPCFEFNYSGKVLMNNDFVIIISNNIGIIYNKKGYGVSAAFCFNKEKNFLIRSSDYPQFVCNYKSVHIECDFTFLCDNKIWATYYEENSSILKHIYIDIIKNQMNVIIPPLETEVVEVISINHGILFESYYEILIYSSDGRIVFKKFVGEYCCASANNHFVAVFKSTAITVFDLLSGLKLHHLPNESYLPEVLVSPYNNCIFLTKLDLKNFTLFSFCAKTGKELWSFRLPIIKKHYVREPFVDVHGSLVILRVDASNILSSRHFSKLYVIKIATGHLVYEDSFDDLLFLSQDCFIKESDPLKLFFV